MTQIARLAFNRGRISKLGFARADVQRVALSADVQTNWVTRVLGSMMIRPGFKFIAATLSNAASRNLPFVFSIDDQAKIELTNGKLRVFVDDSVITRSAVTATVTNGNFDTDLTGWTDNDEAGGTSVWVTGGYMGLTGNGTAAAIRDQQVTVTETGTEHGLKIVIQRGPVKFRAGSSLGADDYVAETDLDTGEHSLAITPTGNIHLRFFSRLKRQVLVDSVNIESSGAMTLNTPWTSSDLDLVKADLLSQSGDILFVACEGIQQRKIERRATRSWSVVRYQANDGPFRVPNIGPITITASALSGNITLTASAALFKSTLGPSTNNDGALFRLNSDGQRVTASVTAQNQFTNAIIVEGVGNQRVFTVTRAGTWMATVTLQRSLVSEGGPWTDVATYTTNGTVTFNDGLDNQTAWYRIGVKTGDFTSGTVELTLDYTVGSISGLVRITGFTSPTVVSADVIEDLGGTDATDDWSEGYWSDFRGWPTAGKFSEGRLWWAGKNGVFGSVSDGFFSFDDEVEGDSGPIIRTIGSGPVDRINWILALQRLILGAQGSEISCRSSSLDEILTPTNFNPKQISQQGSNYVQGLEVDDRGFFVHRGGTKVFQVNFDTSLVDYSSADATALIPEIGAPEIVRMAVQRLPDTRLHFVRSNGTVAMLVFDKIDQVSCWLDITTPGANGLVEDVCVLPSGSGETEDKVYYQVARTVSGGTVRYHERWALESEAKLDESGNLQVCKMADSFVTYNQAASATISGLGHLEGQSVVVWDNGVCLADASGEIATFTVSGGAITVTHLGTPRLATVGMVGLPYTAPWRSAKLVELMLSGSLADVQRINSIALLLADVHAKGLKYGRNLTAADMDDLSEVGEDGASVDVDAIRSTYVTGEVSFPGDFSVDARLCLLGQAPRPCTVLAAIVDAEQS